MDRQEAREIIATHHAYAAEARGAGLVCSIDQDEPWPCRCVREARSFTPEPDRYWHAVPRRGDLIWLDATACALFASGPRWFAVRDVDENAGSGYVFVWGRPIEHGRPAGDRDVCLLVNVVRLKIADRDRRRR